MLTFQNTMACLVLTHAATTTTSATINVTQLKPFVTLLFIHA